jgi:hypothetical protein
MRQTEDILWDEPPHWPLRQLKAELRKALRGRVQEGICLEAMPDRPPPPRATLT